MPTVDDVLIIKDVLEDNWNSSNVGLPVIYHDDSIKNHDYRQDAVKVYQRSLIRKAKNLGYTAQEITTGISIDIRCSNRDRMLLLRDEINRCLNVARKTPSNYHVILFDSEKQVSGYSNFYHYVIDVTLKNYNRTITT